VTLNELEGDMRGMFFRGVVLGSLTAVLVLGASAALAGTGIGGIFNLGQSNTVNATSSLSGSTAGAQLAVANTSTASGARGLSLNSSGSVGTLLAHNSTGPAAAFQSPASVAPFLVNSTGRVTNLNADLLDGIHSSGFVQGKGKVYTLAVSIPRHTDGTINTYIPSRLTAPGFVNISFNCPPTSGSGDSVGISNYSSAGQNIFFRNDDYPSVYYDQLSASSGIGFNANDGGDITTVTVQGAPSGLQTVTTATVSTVVRSSDCFFQVQALTTNP
jgi:hypothetical protein